MLFADLKGSMELLAERDPEEARQLLDPVLERMIEAVHRYEGTVNQVMGMALWPSARPLPMKTTPCAPATRRCACRRPSPVMATRCSAPMASRCNCVGLNAGAVVVRAIDSSLHMDYTAVGQRPTWPRVWSRWRSPGRCSPQGRPCGWPKGSCRSKR